MSRNLSKLKIALSGGNGFLGQVVIARLKQEGCQHIFAPGSKDYDLRSARQIAQFYSDSQPQIVFHLAAAHAGLGGGVNRPADAFFDNTIMGIQMIEQGRRFGIEKFITIGTSAVYSPAAPLPFREQDIWRDYPDPANAPYGIAKRMLLAQLQAYRQQYQLNGIYLIPANLYGPNDRSSNRTRVIPTIIQQCLHAQKNKIPEIVLWGDGTPTREFLYVDDAAQGIIQAAIGYDQPEPLNLGSGRETSIRDLAQLIAQLTGYDGRIRWDTTKPGGIVRHVLDSQRARQILGYTCQTTLEMGLQKTIQRLKENIIV